MKEFALDMVPEYQQPMIYVYNMVALIDTGAIVPVFTMSKEFIEKGFNAKLLLEEAQFGSFSGEIHGSVYSVPKFKVGSFLFEPLEVFLPNEPSLHFPFLLSATMFYGFAYEFDTINNKFIVRLKDNQPLNRKFNILDLKGKLYPQVDGVLLQSVDDITVGSDFGALGGFF